jgi:hypothetical protein
MHCADVLHIDRRALARLERNVLFLEILAFLHILETRRTGKAFFSSTAILLFELTMLGRRHSPETVQRSCRDLVVDGHDAPPCTKACFWFDLCKRILT